MEQLSALMGQKVGPWTISHFAGALLILVVAVLTRAVVITLVGRKLRRLAARTETQADDLAIGALTGPLGLLILLTGLHFAFRVLAAVRPQLLGVGLKAFALLTTIIVAWAALRLIDAGFLALKEKAACTETGFDDQLVPLLRKAAKIFVGVITLLVAAQNLGYSVSGLLAGLGIGGLAFALAAKDTLANLFGSVTVLIDRPFRVGDWISLDGVDGTVEEIGLRSTRVRTFAKTVISIPNQALANATVTNNSQMPARRAQFTLGLTYGTTAAQMREAVSRIEALLREHPGVNADDMLVKFGEFGASSLDISIRYFTTTTNYPEHMAIRQELNLAIMELLEGMGLKIAFPTRTVHVVETEEGAAGG